MLKPIDNDVPADFPNLIISAFISIQIVMAMFAESSLDVRIPSAHRQSVARNLMINQTFRFLVKLQLTEERA